MAGEQAAELEPQSSKKVEEEKKKKVEGSAEEVTQERAERAETESYDPAEMIYLMSSDGKLIQIPREYATLSRIITHFLEDISSSVICNEDSPLPLPEVNYKTLSSVVEWMKQYVERILHTEERHCLDAQRGLVCFDF